MHALLAPPSPLTPFQRRLFWIVTVAVAATRVFALSQSMWDWDEAQFASGVRDFDVPIHHPHPPGFPVYMALGKLVRLVAPSDFAALQTITLIAACALFPLGFLLARELRFPYGTAFLGALLFVFLPNVWFFGGTVFSDIPGVAFTLGAAAMLLRGCRDTRAYLMGAFLIGLAAGMRPQALLLGAAPFAVASWSGGLSARRWKRVLAACFITGLTVAFCYAGAALASASIDDYLAAVRGVGDWVRKYDAYTNPNRPPLATLLDEYFLRPMGAGRLGIVVSVLAALGALCGLVRRDGPLVGLAILTFLPFAVFAFLSLDLHSIHRYSTAFLFLWTLLAAHALAPAGPWPVYGQIAVLLLMIGRYAQWTGVALTEVRSSDAPPYAAVMWLREHVPPGGRVWVHGSLKPFGDYFLYDRDVQFTVDQADVLRRGRADEYYATEGLMLAEGARTLARPKRRIWDVARRRYFDVSIVPIANLWQFGAGWYDEESVDNTRWRWMARQGELLIPPAAGKARLRLTLAAQDRVQPVVEVVLNGKVIDRFALPAKATTKEWTVDSRADAPNRLVLRASAWMNPKQLGLSHDERDLSVMLTSYAWQPLR